MFLWAVLGPLPASSSLGRVRMSLYSRCAVCWWVGSLFHGPSGSVPFLPGTRGAGRRAQTIASETQPPTDYGYVPLPAGRETERQPTTHAQVNMTWGGLFFFPRLLFSLSRLRVGAETHSLISPHWILQVGLLLELEIDISDAVPMAPNLILHTKPPENRGDLIPPADFKRTF
jgi:hypothetical protein